ncbi:MAG: phenylalanine--tRNA ligase subunit beta [Bacteroidota bacterium]
MNISLNWLKQYIDINESPETISAQLTACGLEVESVEPFESIKGGLRGLVVGHVLETMRHPNADRLTVCKVDVGDGQVSQIVCGAPNVAAGQKVIVAIPGTIIHPAKGEPFEIKKSKIRGEASEGMICAQDEIGLGEDHSGIMILHEGAQPGEPVTNHFPVEQDLVLSIGLTPNRSDAASHIGVARDLRAVINTIGNRKVDLTLPDVSGFILPDITPQIEVRIEDKDCIRYAGVHISGVKVGPSPSWLQNRLKSIGLNPINNIVDITNFVLHETGQPLHAFDAARIQGRKVLVKKLPPATPFTTLDGVERKLNGQELMICDEQGAMCMAGIFGGLNSGVSDSSTEVFLESACFSPVPVRKASKHHSLKTDASFRFERGSDPEMVLYALKRAALLIAEIAGGVFTSRISDHYPEPVAWCNFTLRNATIKRITGIDMPSSDVLAILGNLDIRVIKEHESGWDVQVPPYRVDVTREADVCEELLRIYGYDRIPLPEIMRMSLHSGFDAPLESRRSSMAHYLSANGFHEIMSNSLFRSSAYADDLATQLARIHNPLSIELDVLRFDMLLPMLDAAVYNQNRQRSDLRFFEFGKTYSMRDGKYHETNGVGVLLNGLRHPGSWDHKKEPFSFYYLKSMVQHLLRVSGFMVPSVDWHYQADHAHLEECMTCVRSGVVAVLFGKLRKKTMKEFGLQGPAFFAYMNLDLLESEFASQRLKAHEPPRFPEVHRDLSMILDRNIRYSELEKLAFQTDKGLLREVGLFDVYEDAKLGENKKSYALSFVLRDDEKTLTDKEIDKAMQRIMDAFEREMGAVIRKA